MTEVFRPMIYGKIAAVMRDIEAVGKDKRNPQQGYQFRGIDDVYNEVHSHLARHGVFTVPRVVSERSEERTTPKGSVLIYRILTIEFDFFAEDGSSVTVVVIGEGMDSGDKASNKAMSVAHKYALIQVFAIPTREDKDPEMESPEATPRQERPKETSTRPASKPVGPETYTGTDGQKKVIDDFFKRHKLDSKYRDSFHERLNGRQLTLSNLKAVGEEVTRQPN